MLHSRTERDSSIPVRDRRTVNASSMSSRFDADNEDSRVAGLYKALSETGRLDQIRATLRREVFSHLLDSNKSANAVDIDLLTSTPGRLSLAITSGFLKQHFPASFSVFMAEANLAWLPADPDESLILNRLNVPVSKENVIRSSVLECIVQFLLQRKLDEPSDNAKDTKSKSAAVWLPYSSAADRSESHSEKGKGSFPSAGHLETKSAESILSDMRVMIKEELSSLSAKVKPPTPSQLSFSPPTNPETNSQDVNKVVRVEQLPPQSHSPAQTVDMPDESRLREYIEKMIVRIVHNQSDNVSGNNISRESEPSTKGPITKTSPSKSSVEKPKPKQKKTSSKVNKAKSTKTASQPKSSASPRKLKFADAPPPVSYANAGKRQFTTSELLQLESIRRDYTSPTKSSMKEFSSSNTNLFHDPVVEVEDARVRLELLEKEAAGLESVCHQRLASIDKQPSSATTISLIDRLTSPSSRKQVAFSTITSRSVTTSRPFVYGQRTVPSTFDSHLKFTSAGSAQKPLNISGTFTESLLAGMTKKSSSCHSIAAKFQSNTNSKRIAPMADVPLLVEDAINEYNQSNNILLSVPPADHRWAKLRNEQRIQPPPVQSVPIVQPVSSEQLYFSVFPSGSSSQSHVANQGQPIVQQQQQQQQQQQFVRSININPPTAGLSKLTSGTPRTDENLAVTKSSLVRVDSPATQGRSVPHESDSAFSQNVNVVTTQAAIPAAYFASAHLAEQPIDSSYATEMPSFSNRIETLPSIVQSDVVNRHENREAEFVPTSQFAVSHAESDYGKAELYVADQVDDDYSGNAKNQTEEPLPDTKDEEIKRVIDSDSKPPAAETNTIAATAAADEDESVDDVLKKYMQVVMEKRASSQAKSETKPKSSAYGKSRGRDDDDDDDDDVDESPGLFQSRNRFSFSRVSSGTLKQAHDDAPAANDDFWAT